MSQLCNELKKHITMSTRVKIFQTQPEAYKALFGLEKYINGTTLTPTHKELIKNESFANQRMCILYQYAYD